MFADDILKLSTRFIKIARENGLILATAESCTGGLLAAALTEISGSSDVVDCGFVTYSNEAKIKTLGVDRNLLAQFGAVSREIAIAMAQGALLHSRANISISTTGIAGPTGSTPTKPIGLVYLAVARKGHSSVVQVCEFGAIGRVLVREATVKTGLSLLIEQITQES